MRRLGRWGLALMAVCGLGLAGCLYRERIAISGPPDRPVVTIKPSQRGPLSVPTVGLDHLWVQDLDQARVDSEAYGDARVSSEESSARWRKTLVWSIARSTACSGAPKRIAYGVLPPGFYALEPGPARPLVPGHVYSVVVGGCGLIGGGYFKVTDGRIVFSERREDLN